MSRQYKCPNCASYNVVRTFGGKGVLPVVGRLVVMGGCISMVVGLIFPPLLIASFLIVCAGTAIAGIRDALAGVTRLRCRACGVLFEQKGF